jgi:hypothetical protein
MASTTVLTPSGDTTGATDTAAVNAALGGVGAGGSVLLGPGDWYTAAPLAIPAGVELAGIKSGSTGRPRPSPPGPSSTRVAAFSGPGVLSLSPSPARGSGN